MKRLICKLFGHIIDWDEYDHRVHKGDIHAATGDAWCKRCKRYRKL